MYRFTGAIIVLLGIGLWLMPVGGWAAESAKPQAKAKTKLAPPVATRVHRLEAPKVDIASLRDPFESYLTVLERKNEARKVKIRARILKRKREPLEKFDLSVLKLVAIMKMGDSRAAMVEDDEGKGYVVRKGGYIGRDSGRVVSISDRGLVILEDVINPAGEIVKRKAKMTLNEINR